jgi:hypothetical protein
MALKQNRPEPMKNMPKGTPVRECGAWHGLFV